MANKIEWIVYDLPAEWQEKVEFSGCDGYCDSLDTISDYITYLESKVKELESEE